LDGFQNPHTPLALNYSLHMPYATRRIATDGILIPTGDILDNKKGGIFDFWSKSKQLGSSLTLPAALGACGTNCTGYDTCFPFDRDAQLGSYDWNQAPVATLASPWSGIQLDIFTSQAAMQVYSCNNMNGILTSVRCYWDKLLTFLYRHIRAEEYTRLL
jgi:aldose 1-epimerase